MKTQNLIAVALTIALTLVAAALFVWQSREPLPDENPPGFGSLDPGGDSQELQSRSSNPDLPSPQTSFGLDLPECKWGTERFFDEETGQDTWGCSLSGYWDYTTETLEAMAYADAEAARVLAHRVSVSDYSRAIRLALRSTALSGNAVPLVEAQTWRPMVHKNGDMDLSGIGQAYVLMAVADKVNTPVRSRSIRYESLVRRLAVDPDATMQQLNDIVEQMMENIRQVELDVTGQITIGENDDV